ncbi:protein of unknown function DUF58 [Emticicia oligotrophica DSM 17448]|uniref:DUF58 domain-containing protein n=1 Tax=Emticicia oligotrophica (strain DSM 17448 / CIP 109782 / MTCC 6937 / GPTSA100-15) TaxID=929562 RepID=A0ABN4ASW6_EMTOG|nr:DUF58 domain-containing protein [Emticicia oligotrophica]AFK04938.1 protein of unknown function DUF58 [Emticicia oligotrophica DSM 17448]
MLTEELIKLNNLQLAGKLVSEQLMLGIHHSKRTGYGVEFEQYRHYEIGDDPKRIDWKLYARTDKHLVRESSTESNFHLKFIIDLSGSMNYVENKVSRLEYCKILLASLSYLGYRQGDLMSLFGIKNGEIVTLVNSGKQSFQRILYTLEKIEAHGNWENTNSLDLSVLQSGKQKEVLVIASDLLQFNDEWLTLIKSLANAHREILIFLVLGQQELNFNLKGFFRFKDLETGQEIELQAEAIKEEVKKNAENYLTKLEEALQIPFVHLFKTSFDTPIASVILEAIKQRNF